MKEKVDEWQKLLDGRRYNASLDPPYNDTVDLNIDMYNGNQWKNIESNGMPTPVFNIIKRAIQFMVAMITSSKVTVKLKPLEYADEEENENPKMGQDRRLSEIASDEISNLFEKWKMDNRIRDALFKAAQMGDVYAHLYFDMRKKPYGGTLGVQKGEICFELVNGTNVFLGNPNNPTISKYTQPYVIITGRETVKNLKEEASKHAKDGADSDDLTSDSNYQYEAGKAAQIEIESEKDGKALYLIYYWYDTKKDAIMAAKCTESAYMFKDVDTGLSGYPVAGMCWEKQESQYHGRALCTDIIPNQIYINRQFAMVMYHLMNAAFPKRIYNADKIAGITNMIAGSIGVKGVMPGESIMNYVGQLNPGNMSAEIVKVIDMAIQYTKEMVGINDAALGNIDPSRASGVAIASTVRQASIPVENPKSNLYEFIEDVSQITLDMMATYYGERPVVASIAGTKQIIMQDFGMFKDLWLNVRADIGPSTYYSEIANVQMLDNLLNRNDPAFMILDYVETLPRNYQNEELLDRIKENMKRITAQTQKQQQGMAAEQQTMEEQQQEQAQAEEEGQTQRLEQMATFVDKLPEEIQAKIQRLPPDEMEKVVLQLMKKSVTQSN